MRGQAYAINRLRYLGWQFGRRKEDEWQDLRRAEAMGWSGWGAAAGGLGI